LRAFGQSGQPDVSRSSAWLRDRQALKGKFEFNGKSPLVLGKPASSNAEALEFVVWKFNHPARSADKASACCNTF
jgi:hypothetical protein